MGLLLIHGGKSIRMSKDNFRKRNNGTKRSCFKEIMQGLGGKNITIISSVVIAALFVIILLVMFIKSPVFIAWRENGSETQVGVEFYSI